MNDKQLNALFMTHLLPAIQATAGLSTVKLARNYQPRQQGAATGPYVYFAKIPGDRRYGHAGRKDVWNATTQVFDHTEIQQYETTYQFEAVIPQDPASVTAFTESDILNIVSGIMQSDSFLAVFRAAGVGVLRITEVRNPYIVDDRDRFEAVPSFDVTLTHTRISVSTLPAVVAYEANTGRV